MKRLIIPGILVFLLLLAATFPARVAYELFAPPEIQLSGIDGSIWNGTATEALAAGAYVRDISWKLLPSSILSGQLAFDTRSSPMSGTLDARIAVSTDGTLTLSGLVGTVPLDLVHPDLQANGIRGDVSLAFSEVVIRNGVPVSAAGTITVEDFAARALLDSRIGDFRADVQSVGEVIVGNVVDLNGLLNLDASVTVTANREFSFVGEISPAADAPQSLVSKLRQLGPPNAQGNHEFRIEGTL